MEARRKENLKETALIRGAQGFLWGVHAKHESGLHSEEGQGEYVLSPQCAEPLGVPQLGLQSFHTPS